MISLSPRAWAKWLSDSRAHAAILHAAGFPLTEAIRMAWAEGRKCFPR